MLVTPLSSAIGGTPENDLLDAATRGDADLVRALLDTGVSVDVRDENGWTPLMKACWNGRAGATLLLLASHADVNATNARGETAMMKAGQRGNTELMQLLKNAGAQAEPVVLTEDSELKITPAQGWALATVAISNQQNGYSHYVLGGESPTPRSRLGALLGLKAWWGITSREQALDVMDWLLTEGHHAEYDRLAITLGNATPAQIDQILEKTQSDSQAAAKIRFVQENRAKLGNKGIIAWDLCRYIQVAEISYLAGYINADEAWEKIWPAARQIQQTFGSWDEMGQNYLAGRAFWSGEPNPRLDYIYKLLINPQDPHSPWVKYTWSTDLASHTAQAGRPSDTPPSSEQ
ncbi:MAG: DUF1266 domain-containing protein [Verrucomicrobiae bacterium]|nr:DUF1266 domain-containing protein [Verrucomicrobiae bacterium]